MFSDDLRSRQLCNLRKLSSGFTLVELLVVVSVMLILAVMTAAAIKITVSGDKVRAGARQVQSYLAGARDRAIYSKEPRGVRFLLDPTNNRTVSSMVFIAPTEPCTTGVTRIERLDLDGDNFADSSGSSGIVLGGYDSNSVPDWIYLYQQGILVDDAAIRIPNSDTGQWYTIKTDLLQGYINGTQPYPRLRLTTPYQGAGTPNPDGLAVEALAQGGNVNYSLELAPSVLPNQEAVLMPKGSVIHLDRCTSASNLEMSAALPSGSWAPRGDKLPSRWKRAPNPAAPNPDANGFAYPDASGFDYTSRMDVMFSPRGVVIGSAAQRGIIHFYVGDKKDADLDRQYWNSGSYPTASAPEYGTWSNAMAPGYERGDKIILTVFTRTGAISTHPVFSNSDPFRFAETGEVAGK